MNLLQRVVKRLFFKPDQRYLLEMYNHGYIFETGFLKSYRQQEVVFGDGSPAPWFNYSFLDFLTPRLNSGMSIFEYGLGNSTLYFNSISSNCFGVEHDKIWYEKLINKKITKNNYFLCTEDEYINSIQRVNRKFDLIIVDGIQRNECLVHGLSYLSDSGVLILDDSERKEYEMTILEIKSKGYSELKIAGLKALGRHYSSTSVFYKINNCLNI